MLESTGYCHSFYIIIKDKIAYSLKITWCLISNFPLILFVSLSQKIKMFPIFLFTYTYLKYKAVLTTDLLRSLVPIMNNFTKKRKEKLLKENEVTKKSISERLSEYKEQIL